MPRATEKDLDYIFNRLNDAKEIVYDAETSGLDFKRNFICGHVVSFSSKPEDSWYLPVAHESGNNLDVGKINKRIVKALSRSNLKIIGHNLAFDLKFLAKIGHDLSAKYEDTILNAPLLNEHQPYFNLEYCCNMAGVQGKKSAEITQHLLNKFGNDIKDPKRAMGHFWRLSADDSVAIDYAIGDGTSTWQLRDWQHKELEKQNLWKVWDIECRLLPVLARMSVKGIKIDTEYLDKLELYTNHRVNQLSDEFPEGFNPKSPIDMEKLCRDQGATNWPLTPTGRPSFPEMWLDSFDLGKKVVEIRKLKTLLSMFIAPLKKTHLFNGRVHTNFNQLRGDGFGIVTSRISSSEPGMGQAPKRDKKLGPLFRACFIPDDNMTFGEPDYNQCEPRLLAVYSRSKVLLDDYRNNPHADAHQAVADAAGIERHWGKHANMTIINSGGVNVLVNKYHVPPDKAFGLLRDYFRALPEVKQLQIRAGNKFKEKGYVITLLGRRARLIHPGKSYTAVNRLLQGGNADLLKLKLVEMDDYLASEGRPVDILNTVHDSVSFQYFNDAKKYYDKCMEIMVDFGPTSAIPLDVPMKVDSGEGENWSIATYGEEVRAMIDEVKTFDIKKYINKALWADISDDDLYSEAA
jgi:DNA polymerase I